MATAEEGVDGLEFLSDPVDRYGSYFIFCKIVTLDLLQQAPQRCQAVLAGSPCRILKPPISRRTATRILSSHNQLLNPAWEMWATRRFPSN